LEMRGRFEIAIRSELDFTQLNRPYFTSQSTEVQRKSGPRENTWRAIGISEYGLESGNARNAGPY